MYTYKADSQTNLNKPWNSLLQLPGPNYVQYYSCPLSRIKDFMTSPECSVPTQHFSCPLSIVGIAKVSLASLNFPCTIASLHFLYFFAGGEPGDFNHSLLMGQNLDISTIHHSGSPQYMVIVTTYVHVFLRYNDEYSSICCMFIALRMVGTRTSKICSKILGCYMSCKLSPI